MKDCAPYVCQSGACLTECDDDEDCGTGAHCDAPTCVADVAPGDPCDENSDCTTGICNLTSNICCTETCPAGTGCTGPDFTCPPCIPDCTNKTCGDNGCGDSCGTCSGSDVCNVFGVCSDGCGGATEVCCAGGVCESGLVCGGAAHDTNCHPTCGEQGQQCCNDGSCEANLACGTDQICGPPPCDSGNCPGDLVCAIGNVCLPSCGGNFAICCAGEICTGDNECENGTCQPCGGESQACCDGSCNGELVCNATNVCSASCGAAGEFCCAGGACDSGDPCSIYGKCEPCGSEAGQVCCAGGVCDAGLVCGGDQHDTNCHPT